MQIQDFLSQNDTAIDVRVSDKDMLLQTLAARAASALNLPANLIADALEKRDELGSTGIGGGVCIPHARFREVAKPFGLLVRLKHPIPYDAIDGEPIDLAFLLLLPASSQLDQLNALAAVARKLRDQETLQRLRTAENTVDFYRTITS